MTLILGRNGFEKPYSADSKRRPDVRLVSALDK